MKKQEIVQAAFKVWGQQFFRKTSLSQLSDELNVTKPALYKHFRNKEALNDAMFLDFFDRLADFITPYYNEALGAKDAKKSMLLVSRSFIDYFIRNPNDFMFLIVEVHGNEKYNANMTEQLSLRCIDLKHSAFKITNEYPQMLQLIIATCFCMIASFHSKAFREKLQYGDGDIVQYSNLIVTQIEKGLQFNSGLIDALDWAGIEKKVESHRTESSLSGTHAKILKSIIAAVAQAGPWNTSMTMIAETLGLSKSSLYSHFTNKLDILKQIFMSITEDIVKRAASFVEFSQVPEEQLYFAFMGIISYLKKRPEILIMMDWIRVRSNDFEKDFAKKHVPDCDSVHDETIKTIHTIFNGIKKNNDVLLSDIQTDCILFLIVNVLMRRPGETNFCDIKQESFRRLYRFIALGLE
ncbi:MAG: hypothetical protein Ta2G_05170 [Termitinemataceae bacterium]|nr:MAG: hypothetical protein Ta2G_05170 [Termitinemataceae bacterium]